MANNELEEKQCTRLKEAHIEMNETQLAAYLQKPDEIATDTPKGYSVTEPGYKRCGCCGAVKKLYLFNRNKAAKDNCTGTCVICQRKTASKSYKKTKKSRNYARYYQEHAEEKKQRAKKYYQENKERCDEMHRKYVQSTQGKKVMKKAKAKRNGLLAANAGIPYTREQVIDRDTPTGKEYPICYLCGKEITDPKDVHLDHVIGVTIGGLNCFTNVACVHSQCNLRKTKDCVEITPDITEQIRLRAEAYIDEHPDEFDL